jgi:hypothetical protein
MITKPGMKSSNGHKAPSRQEGGVAKRLPIKKMYCTKCKKLITGKIVTAGTAASIDCPICSLHLRVWKDLFWIAAKN